MGIILNLIINALAVLLAARIVPGIRVASFGTALIVALVLAFLNVTLGLFLKIITFPLSILTFGIFLLVINALMFQLATFVKGFSVSSFSAAFFGALVVTVFSLISKLVLNGLAR